VAACTDLDASAPCKCDRSSGHSSEPARETKAATPAARPAEAPLERGTEAGAGGAGVPVWLTLAEAEATVLALEEAEALEVLDVANDAVALENAEAVAVAVAVVVAVAEAVAVEVAAGRQALLLGAGLRPGPQGIHRAAPGRVETAPPVHGVQASALVAPA
jgi:hypothetical protein